MDYPTLDDIVENCVAQLVRDDIINWDTNEPHEEWAKHHIKAALQWALEVNRSKPF